MLKQYNIQQSLLKNNIILDHDDATMIEDTNPYKKYNCDRYIKSSGFTLLHKLVLLSKKYPKMSNVIKEYILLYPEEVNKVNEEGWSALLLAVSNEVPKIVKLLVKCNADVNIIYDNGWTPLMHASCGDTESSLEIVKLLLEHNANVNVKNNNNNNGGTALMYASYYASKLSVEIVKLLVKHNADVNVKSSNGGTALMKASYNPTESSPKIIKLLLEYDSIPSNEEPYVVKNIKVLNTKN